METAILVLAAVAAAALVASAVLLVALLRQRGRSRADLEAVLAHARAETGELRRRLEALTERIERPAPGEAEFVITSVGEAVPATEPLEVPDRLVLGATLGEPLVKAAAFTHGVRRALSAESRNRIRFAMRQEARRSRRERRREMKAAWRAHQARFRESRLGEAQRADGLVDPA